MTIQEKREIQYKLRIFVSSFTSQKKACTTLEGASESTIIAMLNQDEVMWDKISDAMWRTVAAHVGGVVDFDSIVETQNFKILNRYFNLAKKNGASFSIVGNPGWGKTFTSKWYSAINRKENVYYLECAEYLDKKMFLKKLLLQAGTNSYLKSTGELMENLVRQIRKQKNPLIILDEVDKLPDYVLKFFITLYNELNKHCGFVWLSTDAIEKRMIKGIEKRVIGYPELFSRIGATFITLREPTTDEVAEICQNNGITDKLHITKVCNEVKDVKGDLRRVERNILKFKEKKSSSNKAA